MDRNRRRIESRSPAVVIGYTLIDTPAGLLLVAGSKRGVCWTQFGSSRSALALALQGRYPKARLVKDAPWIRAWGRALAGQLDGDGPPRPLPLDLEGTAFQLEVWSFLRKIPRGSTVTYGALARSLGRTGAARAVARACAANPVAVAIPCHRVVRSDGDLGGYRWGARRKRQLLAMERRRKS